jgi:Protein of unknown function (DUF3987)
VLQTQPPKRNVSPLRYGKPTDQTWPGPLDEQALYGLAGDIVRTIAPQSESDPAAILLQSLAAFGALIGRGPHWMAESTRHGLNLFTCIVGNSSKSRKGTSWGHVKRMISTVDPEFTDCIQSGLSSGEGLIHAVRDPEKDHKGRIVDRGISDKRLLVIESEFASPLRVISRDGNTLSPTLRQAWDGGTLQVMTKNSPTKASGAHISTIGHVTRDELRFELTRTDEANGFANRFLWVCAARSKRLPHGGRISDKDFQALAVRLKSAYDFSKEIGDWELARDEETEGLWECLYSELSEGKPGLFGAVTSRAEAQTMRLACIYALLDESHLIQVDHLSAAEAVWRYCEASAKFIFGDSLGNPLADELLRLLRNAENGMTRTDLSHAFGRNKQANQIGQALTLLREHGLARFSQKLTLGRPAERWFAVR